MSSWGTNETYFFLLDWPLPVGRALRFLGPSGAGVPRGLLVLALGAAFPNTLLIARSMGSPPFVVFSTLRRFGGGFPLAVAPEMPRPTLASAGFLDLLLWGFLPPSPLCRPVRSSASES